MKLKGSVEHIDMPVPMVTLVHNGGTSGASLVATLDLSAWGRRRLTTRIGDAVIRMWEFGPIYVNYSRPA